MMEFSQNINIVLPEVLCRFDGQLLHKASNTNKRYEIILQIIDHLGQASAKAQGLQTPITSGSKLLNSNHIIYILTDPLANEKSGAVIGMLKIGQKRLFLINEDGVQVETFPLCVLDFYVHESCQRYGYGKKLFEFMLKMENVLPMHLAIDKPSDKFLSFLQKHYSLKQTIEQSNNFVIFKGFFSKEHGVSSVGQSQAQKDAAQDTVTNKDVRRSFDSSFSMDTQSSRDDVAAVVFGKDISRFSRNLGANDKTPSPRAVESMMPVIQSSISKGGRTPIAELSHHIHKRKTEFQNTPSSSGSGDSFSNNSTPIKWHQHHVHDTSWNVLGVPPPRSTERHN